MSEDGCVDPVVDTYDTIGLLKSQRAMLLLFATACYTAIIIASGFGANIPPATLELFGAVLLLGYGFFFKDRNSERIASMEK